MRQLPVVILSLVSLGCVSGSPTSAERLEPTVLANAEKPTRPLSEIDLTRIRRISPKGRVQDKDYNQLEVIDQLIANGKESIPYLINKLDDETVIPGRVIDYWYQVTVADVALVILTDFAIDSSGKNTIPGTSWEEIFKGELDRDTPAYESVNKFVAKHGRGAIKSGWQRTWEKYKDRISWDDHERCFVLR